MEHHRTAQTGGLAQATRKHLERNAAECTFSPEINHNSRLLDQGKSEKLRGASKNYVNQARYLNTQAMLRKYGPMAFVLLLVIGMLWWRFR